MKPETQNNEVWVPKTALPPGRRHRVSPNFCTLQHITS